MTAPTREQILAALASRSETFGGGAISLTLKASEMKDRLTYKDGMDPGQAALSVATCLQTLAIDLLEAAYSPEEAHKAVRLWEQLYEGRRRARGDEMKVMPSVIDEIALERARQVSQEGFDHAHDDAYTGMQLSEAALNYVGAAVLAAGLNEEPFRGEPPFDDCIGFSWPWARGWWKPGTVRRMLIKAGALIVADVERLDRAEARRAMATPAAGDDLGKLQAAAPAREDGRR